MPAKSHGAAAVSTIWYEPCFVPLSFARYCDAEERRLGPAELPPELHAAHPLAVLLHLPEEVVRREEDQAAAQVAEPLHDVVRMLGHVLGVPGEDDEVVEPAQLVTVRERLEVVLGEHVRRAAGAAEELEERNVGATEPGRRAALPVGPRQAHRRVAARVPRVAPAVAVGVVEVVGLPRVRRHHHRLAHRAERRGPEDQRSEADSPVLRRQLGGVDAADPRPRRERDRVRRRSACASSRTRAAGRSADRASRRRDRCTRSRCRRRGTAPSGARSRPSPSAWPARAACSCASRRRPRRRGRGRPGRSTAPAPPAGCRRTTCGSRGRRRRSAASRRCRRRPSRRASTRCGVRPARAAGPVCQTVVRRRSAVRTASSRTVAGRSSAKRIDARSRPWTPGLTLAKSFRSPL